MNRPTTEGREYSDRFNPEPLTSIDGYDRATRKFINAPLDLTADNTNLTRVDHPIARRFVHGDRIFEYAREIYDDCALIRSQLLNVGSEPSTFSAACALLDERFPRARVEVTTPQEGFNFNDHLHSTYSRALIACGEIDMRAMRNFVGMILGAALWRSELLPKIGIALALVSLGAELKNLTVGVASARRRINDLEELSHDVQDARVTLESMVGSHSSSS